MKKSLLALATLTAFAGAASAQSSVTLYGRLDPSVARNLGTKDTVMQNGSGSRLGVRGVEDMGGGLKAHFTLEHRFDADDAEQTSAKMWNGRAVTGIMGSFGKISFGREYATSFLGSQLQPDPWGWDTVASQITAAVTGGGIAKVRYDNSITYDFAVAGFSLGVQTAVDKTAIGKRPVNMAVGYGVGPFKATVGYEKPNMTSKNEKVMTGNVMLNFGQFGVNGHVTDGKNAANAKVRGYLLAGTAQLGAGQLRVGYGRLKVADNTTISGIVAGYHYSLSKRSTLYVDYGRNGKLAANKWGYDVGFKHNF